MAMNYTRIKNLGTGGVGSVDLVKADGEFFALKTISKQSINYFPQHVANEMKAGTLVQHANIGAPHKSWEDRNNVYLLMEYVGGWDLFGFMESLGGAVSEKTTRQIFRQIIDAVKCLHSKGIAHRDLKLDNVMVDYKLKAKIIDFGLCQVQNAARCSEKCGSPEYSAPEIAGAGRYNAFSADIWSLGVVLFTLLYGSFPFNSSDRSKLKIGCPVRLPFGISSDVSRSAKDLLLSMLRLNPKRRPTIDEVAQHEFFNEGI
eukprot:TRINITY_DN6876_c0_g1_i2.p1 TRINITY_DN6876_c0_g1~~TRINITY_DN6876_c0_g1_i2.p1  ORF type:complete len:259 (+),score=30.33 TRINITY_DN6876_c0_g1_i2:450-1226(+)